MHQDPDPVGLSPEWRNHARRSVVSPLDDQLPQFRDHSFRFSGIQRAAARGTHDFAPDVDPPHGRSGWLRAVQGFVIRGNTKLSAIEMPV